MENELLDAKVDHLEAGGPLARRRSCVAPSRSPRGVRRTTGLPRVGTGAVQRLRATARDAVRASRRRGPVGAATDEVLGRPHPPGAKPHRFMAKGPESVGEAAGREDPHLAGTGAPVDAGARPPAPYRAGHAHGPKAHDGTITTAAPNVVGDGHDVRVTVGEGAACVFVAVDHCTPSASVSMRQGGKPFEALEPIRQGVRDASAPSARGRRWAACATRARTTADDFQQEVAFFGIESSPSFVRSPKLGSRSVSPHVKGESSFETIEELRLALLEFQRTYNEPGEVRTESSPSATRFRRGRGSVEVLQTTVQEPWGATQAVYGRVFRNLAEVRAAVAAFVERYNQCWRLEQLAYAKRSARAIRATPCRVAQTCVQETGCGTLSTRTHV